MRRILDRHELHLVPDAHAAPRRHRGVQREPAVEAAHDRLEHVGILSQGVRVVGRHHAPSAQVGQGDDHLADTQPAALPAALVELRHAADDQVGAQPAAVVAEGGDGAVGGDQQRQDVEDARGRGHDLRALAGDRGDRGGDAWVVPRLSVDQDRAVVTGAGPMSEQT